MDDEHGNGHEEEVESEDISQRGRQSKAPS